jgi:4-amino-4-deoxy-L-arabinose transferase-like glycosyltransferase
MMISKIAKSERVVVFGILALAAALRIAAAIVLPDQSHALLDAVSYRDSAAQLLQTWHMGNLFQMPLYPLLIAMTGPGLGQLGADIALSVTSVWLVYALADELFGDQYARLLAAAATACYPPLIFFSVVGLSETLFIALVLAAFLYWYRGRFTAAAIFAVLAILTRPVFDLFAPVLILLFALIVHRLPVTRAIQQLGIYVLVYCALMTPWWVHNAKAYGSFVRLTPGAGTALYAGNNPLNRSGGGNIGIDYELTGFANIADPIERDRALRDAAIAYIVHNPQRFAELAVLKFLRIWRLWPVNEAYRTTAAAVVLFASFVPVLLLAAFGLYANRGQLRRLSPVLLFGIGYTAVHMVLVGTIRYRLPLEPFLIILAGAGASYLVRRRRGRAPSGTQLHAGPV